MASSCDPFGKSPLFAVGIKFMRTAGSLEARDLATRSTGDLLALLRSSSFRSVTVTTRGGCRMWNSRTASPIRRSDARLPTSIAPSPKELLSSFKVWGKKRKLKRGGRAECFFGIGVPAGTSQKARAVCIKEADPTSGASVRKAYWATGASSNSFVFSQFRFMDQIEVVPCNNRTAASKFVPVDDLRFCRGTMKVGRACVISCVDAF